jgi:hypothetical protein
MDVIILEFIQENFITISIILAVLKMIAKETPWATDDKIIEIFTGLIKLKYNK